MNKEVISHIKKFEDMSVTMFNLLSGIEDRFEWGKCITNYPQHKQPELFMLKYYGFKIKFLEGISNITGYDRVLISWDNKTINTTNDSFPKANVINSIVLTNRCYNREKYKNHQIRNVAVKEYIRSSIFLEAIETMKQLSTYTVTKMVDRTTLANNFCVSIFEVNHYIQYFLELFMDKGYIVTTEELDRGLILLTINCKDTKIHESIEVYMESKKNKNILKELLDNE